MENSHSLTRNLTGDNPLTSVYQVQGPGSIPCPPGGCRGAGGGQAATQVLQVCRGPCPLPVSDLSELEPGEQLCCLHLDGTGTPGEAFPPKSIDVHCTLKWLHHSKHALP